jgi:hypothetical protein
MTLSELFAKAEGIHSRSHAQETADAQGRGRMASYWYFRGVRAGLEAVFPRLREQKTDAPEAATVRAERE